MDERDKDTVTITKSAYMGFLGCEIVCEWLDMVTKDRDTLDSRDIRELLQEQYPGGCSLFW